MFRSLIKLRSLFDRRDAIQLGLLFAAILLMALLEVVGIASILPFMRLVAEPDVINDNEWFKWVYETFNFSSPRALLITVGIAVITFLTISNAFAAFTTWLQDKFAWSIAHSVSMRLAALRRPAVANVIPGVEVARALDGAAAASRGCLGIIGDRLVLI